MTEVPPDRYADASSYDEPRDGAASAPDAAGDAESDEGPAPEPDAGDFDAGMGGDAGAIPANPDCDFSGRWLITERLVASGLGIKQATLWWVYLEVEQSGENLRVKKGLVCGTGANRVGSLGVSIDMHEAWPAMQAKNDPHRRTGKAKLMGSRCSVQWGRDYRVLGATMPYYGDTSRPLPSLEQPAQGDTVGWEDWDRDGQPGISIHISGVLNGTRYSASRSWTSYSGQVDKRATTFRLPLDWGQEESVLGVTTDALKAAGAKDGDASLHYAVFAKLSAAQAVGTDSEVCASVRSLAPELTADAY
ncbi:MAG: hypothetical protein QM778_06640 [Myxococcales bacterium]